MRRAFPLIAMFAVGVIVGLFVLRTYGQPNMDAARRNVVALLEKPPAPSNIGNNPFVTAAAIIEPAVVNIDTAGVRRQTGFDMLGRPVAQDREFLGKGSGVIISPDGFIITNNHVIESASVIRVTTTTDAKYQAELVGADPENDIAIIKIDGKNLPHATMGDSDGLKVGEYSIAIGNPLGVGTTVTHGIISATDRKNLPVGDGRILSRAIQTDAPINRGNSGGALANINGQLIGINTAIRSDSGGNIGIGFAIPINVARTVAKSIIAQGGGAVKDPGIPYIGIVAHELLPEDAANYRIPSGQGVVIQVVNLGPADSAGLKSGTIVIAIDGQPIGSLADVRAAIRKHKVGQSASLTIVTQDGSRQKVDVVVGRRPKGLE
jgi:S1-C subfamily serine protease